MNNSLNIGFVIIGIFAMLSFFQTKLPKKDNTRYTHSDLPNLRKRFSITFVIMILLNLGNF